MKKIYLLIFVALCYLGSNAQENPKINTAEFFNNENGVIKAKTDLKKADKYYRKGMGTYDEALKTYLNVHKYNSKSRALNYKIGICYLYTSNKKAALPYFLSSDTLVSEDYYLALGRAYQYNLQFSEAKQAYENYLASLKTWRVREESGKVNQLLKECDNSEFLMKGDTLPVFIENLGPLINSYYDDYGAYLPSFDTVIYFTSKRPVVEPRKKVSRFKFGERLLMASNAIDRPCEWVEKVEEFTSRVNVGLAGVDKQEKKIYVYQGKWHNGSLTSAEYSKNKWRNRKVIKGKINHIAYKETNISVADDGTAYYITEHRGGYGGKDIWVADAKGDNKWINPRNLSEVINTPFDESTVYVTGDGLTLYFSSNGHEGMGGQDIYKTTRDVLGNWGKPINLGHPINSPADEFYYHPTADSLVALYATIREDSYGGLDIYKVQTDPSLPFKLIGSVSDEDSGEILPAVITVFDNKTDQIVANTNVDTVGGIYMIDFKDGGDFYLEIQSEGYLSVGMDMDCPKEKYATLPLDFKLKKLKHPFSLVGIVRDLDSNEPIQATVQFVEALTDSVIGRAVSNDLTGQYSITFPDKFDMVVNITATDYFSDIDSLNTTNETGKVITRDFTLKRSKIDYVLTGKILNEETNKSVKAAISLYRPTETEPFQIIFSDSTSGVYKVVVNEKGPFFAEVEADGYFFLTEPFQFEDNTTLLSKNFKLKPIAIGAKIVINNLLFKAGKSTLQAQSYAELDKFSELLSKNPTVRIEVSGHTDNVGSASVNKKISRSRALTVKNYLVSRGIEDSRVEYVGYGFDQPIAPNDTPEGREKNRRVQVKVLN